MASTSSSWACGGSRGARRASAPRLAPRPFEPNDFAAWIEVFLGGRWHTFDPRNNTPRIGRVLIARGRDACDVALSSTFGPNTLEGFKVWTDVVDESVTGTISP